MGAEWDMWGQEGDPAVETHGPMKGNLSGGDTHTHTHTHTQCRRKWRGREDSC